MTNQTNDLNEQMVLRREKLKKLREQTQNNAYPNDFKPNAAALALHEQYDPQSPDALEAVTETIQVAGRIMMQRRMGRASFIQLKDRTGRIQVYLRENELPEGQYALFQEWDLGDIIGVCGRLFKTKTGELSIRATQIRLLTKALCPLPDKWHGLADQETRYRQRYLDLMVTEKTQRTFIVRTKVIQAIRDFLVARSFLEVETPMMQVLPGGATARPFVTFHNSLEMDLYLRVAPELYLKRLVVGGFERVFEINRNFRNEGVSTQHNPEFTMVEFYQAYADYHDLMDLTEILLREVAQTVLGTQQVVYQTQTVDLSQPFERLTLKQAILKYNPELSETFLADQAALKKHLASLEVKIEPHWGIGKLQLELFEKTVESQLSKPTFITAYPKEVSPLARSNVQDPSVTDRFEFFMGGSELANGFSELNDPEDQAARFKAQAVEKKAGDLEAMPYDQDYIKALEYGLPPTAGEGIGIDRLVMFFTDSPSIRDVILFPHMRLK